MLITMVLSLRENMKQKYLTPDLEAQYRFLKKQVNDWLNEWTKRPESKEKYYHAKDQLKIFKQNRRDEGYKI